MIDPPDPQPTVVRESSERSLALDLGFGVEASAPGGLLVGVTPAYQRVYAHHVVQYITVTVYLKF